MQTFEIHNRRYLGSKTRLLELIESVVRTECKRMDTFADLFAGTGVVSNSFFKSTKIIVNDILLSNYHSYISWFDKRRVSRKKLNQIIDRVNQAKSIRSNYFSKNFAGTYFSNKKQKKSAFSACFLSKSKIHVHVQSSPLKGHLRYCYTTIYGKQLCYPLEIR